MLQGTWLQGTWLHDGLASAVVALSCALVVWLLPFVHVPVLALLTGPLGLVMLGVCGLAPVMLIDPAQPLPRVMGGALLLAVGGQLSAFGTLWLLLASHDVALGIGRGNLRWSAALDLGPSLLWLLVPWALLAAGLWAARGMRVGWAWLTAGVLVAVAPATANVQILYVWLGLPLSA